MLHDVKSGKQLHWSKWLPHSSPNWLRSIKNNPNTTVVHKLEHKQYSYSGCIQEVCWFYTDSTVYRWHAPQWGASTKLYRDLYRTTAHEDFVTALRAIPPTAVKPIYSHLHPVGKPQNCTLGGPHCDRIVTFMVYAFSIITEAPTCWGQQISRQANSCANSNLKWLKELSEPEGG